MSARYSAFALLQQGLAGHKGWPVAWRKAKPKPAYDFVIVGGGGHGLAAAYYLAKTHKRTRVCVIEKGAEIGAHILSGAVMDPKALNELDPDWKEKGGAAYVPVQEDRFLFLSKRGGWQVPMRYCRAASVITATMW